MLHDFREAGRAYAAGRQSRRDIDLIRSVLNQREALLQYVDRVDRRLNAIRKAASQTLDAKNSGLKVI